MANTESAGLTADAPPVRYRVSGMDCQKDAAQIERAGTVGRSRARRCGRCRLQPHIMTLNALAPAGHRKAVAVTGYGFDRIDGDEDIPPDPAHQDPAYRAPSGSVVILNWDTGSSK